MKPLAAIGLGLLLIAPVTRATATPLHFDVHVDVGGHNLDLHLGHGGLLGGLLGGGLFHRGFDDFGGLFDGGFLGLSNIEAQQVRYEDKFTDLTAAYNDGVANVEDFYTSDEYTDVVDDATRLAKRYDFFVTRVEHSIDFLDSAIDASNDSLTFVQDLLTDYQSRDLSEKRLAHIEDVLTTIQGNIQLKIDLLTEKQSTLTERLPTYQDFQSQLTTYRDTIVAAGGGTTDDNNADASSAALRAFAATTGRAANASGGVCAAPSGGPSAAPEPSAATLAVLASVALLRRRRRTACV